MTRQPREVTHSIKMQHGPPSLCLQGWARAIWNPRGGTVSLSSRTLPFQHPRMHQASTKWSPNQPQCLPLAPVLPPCPFPRAKWTQYGARRLYL